jgi:hypothetical protein
MKRIVLFFIFFGSWMCMGQSKDTVFILHYHSNKKIATKEVKLSNDQLWGYAKAFDQQGKEIYLMHTRRVAGHATVDFSYYASGAVRQAHFTSHPDGGIQWSDITHRFDENGKITEVIDNSSDDFGHYRVRIDSPYQLDTIKYPVSPPVVVPSKKQEVIRCAEIYSTEVYLINATGKTRKYKALQLKSSFDELQQKGEIAKNDTVKIGSYHEAQIFTHPKERLKLEVIGKKKDVFQFFWEEPKQEGNNKRTYYLVAVKRF